MAQHLPISNVATTTGITGSVLGVYMHAAWKALLIMSTISLVLMLYGHVRLMLGKRELKLRQIRLKTNNKVQPARSTTVRAQDRLTKLGKPPVLRSLRRSI